MILRNDMDRKHWRIGALHPYTGWLQRTESDDTTSKYTRKKSGSPVIWDTSKVGAVVYDPLV